MEQGKIIQDLDNIFNRKTVEKIILQKLRQYDIHAKNDDVIVLSNCVGDIFDELDKLVLAIKEEHSKLVRRNKTVEQKRRELKEGINDQNTYAQLKQEKEKSNRYSLTMNYQKLEIEKLKKELKIAREKLKVTQI